MSVSFGALVRCSGVLLAAGILAGAALMLGAPTSVRAQDAAPATFSAAADAPLYRAFDRTVTTGEFQRMVRYFPPEPLMSLGGLIVDLSKHSPDAVRAGIEETVREEAIARAARADGYALPDFMLERLENDTEVLGYRIWLDRQGVLDPIDVPEADLRERYESVKDEQFKREEEVVMQHIFFSTYEEVLSEEGDTFESIAERISGDASRWTDIMRRDDATRRTEPVVTTDGEEVAPRALVAGERLLVPMGAEARAAVLASAEEVLARLREGTDFVKMADEFSQSDAPGRTITIRPRRDEKPINPDLRAAFDAIEDGEVSDVVETRHGYQIIKRIRYQAEGYRPFENVSEMLRSQIENERRLERYEAALRELFERDDTIAVDQDLLADVFNAEKAEEVLFVINDNKYVAGSYVRDFGTTVDENSSIEERLAPLTKLPMVQQHLLRNDVNRLGLRQSPEYSAQLQVLENRYLARTWPEASAHASVPEPTEDELVEIFNSQRAALTLQPSAEVWQIVLPLGDTSAMTEEDRRGLIEDKKAYLSEMLEGVDNQEKFSEVARRVSADQSGAEGGRLGIVRRHSLDGVGARLAVRDRANSLFDPITISDETVRAFWIGEVRDSREPSLDEVRPQVVARWRLDKQQQIHREKVEAAAASSNLEILIP